MIPVDGFVMNPNFQIVFCLSHDTEELFNQAIANIPHSASMKKYKIVWTVKFEVKYESN